MSKVGFIGLGKMGAPMAGHLQNGGHTLFVNTRSGVPDALKAAGADSFTVTVVVAVTGAGGCGVGGCTQHRSGTFFGRVGAGGGGVVSDTVTSTVKVPVLFGVNVKSGLLLPEACPLSFQAYASV